jgi:hypothetical protein
MNSREKKRKNIYHTLSHASVSSSENYGTKQCAIVCVKAEEINLALTETIKFRGKKQTKTMER